MKAYDLTGSRFGKLIVLKKLADKAGNRFLWLCQCDCGGLVKGTSVKLRDGDLKSCGCLKEKHGDHKTRLYQIWSDMKTRCLCETNGSYARYGGRGIKVCPDWMKYSNFKSWALSNGYADNLQIDRTNNNGNYEPSNCRWVTPAKNTQNRNCVKLSATDVLLIREKLSEGFTVAELSRQYHVGTTIISNIKNNKKWIEV